MMYHIRVLVVRHSRKLEKLYNIIEKLLVRLHPFFEMVGYDRIEKPVAYIERSVKGLLFDCSMCGQCVLSSTGMTCPMNCPKQLRNGPCGGVTKLGTCEIFPEMRCVWVLAWDGASRMKNGDRIKECLPPVDHSLFGSSSWLRVARDHATTKLRNH
jgi:hypothetical protein